VTDIPEDKNEKYAAANIAIFLDALDEWGCDDNEERAKAIIEFQKSGYDLSAYREEHGRD
jgi:hypothetical protein